MQKNSKSKYLKHGREYWSNHIDAWQESGLSQAGYCRQKKIPLSSFGNWKSKLYNESVSATPFIELRGHFPERDNYFELHLEEGVTFRIRESILRTSLQNILMAIRGM